MEIESFDAMIDLEEAGSGCMKNSSGRWEH